MSRILSIQSHVVHGYVGNKVAVYSLQRFGHDVDVINTVDLSNHTGYRMFRGMRKSACELKEIFCGLIENGFCEYDYVLIGYVGSAECLNTIKEFLDSIITRYRPRIVIDPVMGDNGKLYVNSACLDQYENIISSMDIFLLTPNQFEAECLCRQLPSIHDIESACMVLKTLRNKYKISNIVITSVQLDSNPSLLFLFGINEYELFSISFEKLEYSYKSFSGTGDLVSALLIAYMDRMCKDDSTCSDSLSISCQKILQIVQHVIKVSLLSTREKEIRELNFIEAFNSIDLDIQKEDEFPIIFYQ